MSPALFAIAVIWVACGVFTAGVICADLTHGSSDAGDYRVALSFSIFFGLAMGPPGALMALCLSGFLQHGWSLRRYRRRR